MQLKSRQKAILAAVIEHHVHTAEPVGSAALASNTRLQAQFGALSSATIRNELAELEQLGFLSQPHTSAGRVPTDAGWRLYVNEMLSPRPILASETAQLEAVAPPSSSVEDVLREATTILARLTGYPAVASLPAASRDTMRQLQLNMLPPRQLILVLVTGAGRVEHRVFEVDAEISAPKLQSVVNFLNENLGNRTLSAVRALDFETVSRGLHDAQSLTLARKAWELVRSSVSDLTDEQIVVQGLVTLLNEPEFSQIGSAREAMRLFEDEVALGGFLRGVPELEGGRAVVLGRELPSDNPATQWFSFVGVAYGAGGETLGALGVMGPARMRYSDAAALVPALAARLQICLETF